MYRMALLQAEVAELQEANTIISKRRRAKKTRIRQGGSLNVQEAEDLQDQKDVELQVRQETRENGSGLRRGQARQRCCGVCGKPGHNARTCQIDIESSGQEYSE